MYDGLALPYSMKRNGIKRDSILVKKKKKNNTQLPDELMCNFTFKIKGNSKLTDDSDAKSVPPEQSDL